MASRAFVANAVFHATVRRIRELPITPDKLGHRTQTWLAVSDHPGANGSGGYWYHLHRQAPAPAALDAGFQDALLDELAHLTGVRLF